MISCSCRTETSSIISLFKSTGRTLGTSIALTQLEYETRRPPPPLLMVTLLMDIAFSGYVALSVCSVCWVRIMRAIRHSWVCTVVWCVWHPMLSRGSSWLAPPCLVLYSLRFCLRSLLCHRSHGHLVTLQTHLCFCPWHDSCLCQILFLVVCWLALQFPCCVCFVVPYILDSIVLVHVLY